MNPFASPPSAASARQLTIPPQTPRPEPVARGESALIAALGASPVPAEVDAFWTHVVREGTPLVEGDGPIRNYTFLYRGEAERVGLVLNKIVDDTTLADALLDRIPGTDIWVRTLRLGAGWRGSYALAVDDGGDPVLTGTERAEIELRRARSLSVTDASRHGAITAWFDLLLHQRPDPIARTVGPRGSIAAGPEAQQPWIPPACVAPGTLVPVPHERRSAQWHVPAGDPGPEGWHVLVLLDGERWVAEGTERLDAWTAGALIPPTITLLLGHGALEPRVADLTCNPELVADIGAMIDDAPRLVEMPVTRDPAHTTIAGQSLGGLTALYAQCLNPGRFGASICQSGSFWWPHPTGNDEAEWLTRTIRDSRSTLGRVYLEVGTGEWVLYEPTRRLREVLRDRAELDYREFDGGHDIACWEVSLPHALRRITRPPGTTAAVTSAAPGAKGGRA